MGAAFLGDLGQGRVEVRSAGSAPADTGQPAMVEAGIDISAETPKALTVETVQSSAVYGQAARDLITAALETT